MNFIKVSFVAGLVVISNALFAQDSLQFNPSSEYGKIADKAIPDAMSIPIAHNVFSA